MWGNDPGISPDRNSTSVAPCWTARRSSRSSSASAMRPWRSDRYPQYWQFHGQSWVSGTVNDGDQVMIRDTDVIGGYVALPDRQRGGFGWIPR